MIRKGNYCISIGELPGYKKPCLLIGDMEQGRFRKVGTFNDQAEADNFMEMLNYFVFGEEMK